MADKAQIEHRYSFLRPHPEGKGFDADGFYRPGAFPDTQKRMRFYEQHALGLATRTLDQINFAEHRDSITHVIITTCTGFYAPGLDIQLIKHYGLQSSVERTVIGFMGCNAALNALKLSRHIVRSAPSSKVAIINLELCTLHLQETDRLEQLLSFLIFADGCSASLVSATPIGIELQDFTSTIMPNSVDQITWHIGGLGFDMVLMGKVPSTIMQGIPENLKSILCGQKPENIEHSTRDVEAVARYLAAVWQYVIGDSHVCVERDALSWRQSRTRMRYGFWSRHHSGKHAFSNFWSLTVWIRAWT